MINGNTLMTTWSKEVNGNSVRGVFRSYELVDGVFLPVSVNSHAYSSTYKEPPFFYFNDQIVACGPCDFANYVSTAFTYNYAVLFNSALNRIKVQSDSNTDFKPVANTIPTSLAAFDKTRNLLYFNTAALDSDGMSYANKQFSKFYASFIAAYIISSNNIQVTSSRDGKTLYNDGMFAFPAYTNRNPIYLRGNSLTVSPNGKYITWLNCMDWSTSYPESTTGLKIYNTGGNELPYDDRTDYVNRGYVNHAHIGTESKLKGTSTVSILSANPPTHVQWTPDSRYLITCNAGSTTPINVFKDIDGDFMQVSSVTDIPRNIYNILTSPDNRMLAVVVEGTGGIGKDTLLYKRKGSNFNLVQTITKFGLAASFNASGSILLDVSERKAYRLDDIGQFVEDTKLMSKVVAGATALALSDHVPEPPVSGYVYDNTVPMLVKDHYEANDLSICFLSNDAIFNKSDATIDVVTGVANNKSTVEVNGFGWPVGGKKLENVKLTPSEGSVIVTADNLSQDIAGGTLRFSKAVIYENTTKKPWLWFDFGHEVIVESGTTLSVEFSTKGFLVFAP